MRLAPICISTYKRRTHLERTLNALARNELAADSELHIFSDAAKPGDERAVAEVRQLIRAVSGFRHVYVTERESNDRVFNNRQGICSLLDNHGRCIFLEEDVVTATSFLTFMNEGLESCRRYKQVFALCGYTPPAGLHNFHVRNSFLSPRFSAWGFGIWAHRYQQIEQGLLSLDNLTLLQRRKLRTQGMDMVKFVNRMAAGELEALDVRVNFTLARLGLYVINPTRSLTLNIGHDGTGAHCVENDYFDSDLDERTSVDWDFHQLHRNRTVERELFFYRGRHVRRRSNLIRYHLTRKIDFGK